VWSVDEAVQHTFLDTIKKETGQGWQYRRPQLGFGALHPQFFRARTATDYNNSTN